MKDENRGPGPSRRPYAPPRLVVYGPLRDLTLTDASNQNMNDMFGNLKTA